MINKPIPKEYDLHIRLSETEMAQVIKASERMKLSKSAYARMIIVSDAEKRNMLADRMANRQT